MKTILTAFLLLACSAAAAQPVKCVDAKGKVRYIDQSMMAQEKCEPVKNKTQIMQTQPGAINPSASAPPPNVDQREASVRAAEQQLEQARKALADQEAIRNGDEKNYQRVLDRLKPYQDAVTKAEQNLDQARRNLR
jgi:Domain of unknown function (DUF4124)